MEAERIVREIAGITASQRALIAAVRGEPMDQGDQFEALVDVARLLAAAEVPYAIIGAFAVGIHTGDPRATRDIDVAVPSTRDRAQLIGLLKDAGFTLRGEYPHSLNFRHANGQPVQLVFDAPIDPAIVRAHEDPVGGVPMRFVTKDDLIAMKERAARDPSRRRTKAMQDEVDLRKLRGDVPDPDEGW